MGDVNQFEFVSHIAPTLTGPFLEIGSRNYGNTQDLRSMFMPCGEYVGVDMSDGEGVDYVVDLTRPFAEIDTALHGKRFATIFCLSVLEHRPELINGKWFALNSDSFLLEYGRSL